MTDTDRHDPLYAVSPLDGRYTSRTAPLAPHVSEAALMRVRVEVEAGYPLALADLDVTPFSFSESERAGFRALYEESDVDDADLVKRLEVESTVGFSATNHDVKAAEYLIRIETDESIHPWIHFGLTSEDVNNLAQHLMVKSVVEEVLILKLRDTRDEFVSLAQEFRDVSMLVRTCDQPATPTTFDKGMAVYVACLGRTLAHVETTPGDLAGKLAGAPDAYATHVAAYPGVDWRAFPREFVGSLDFEHTTFATQVNPCNDLVTLFDAVCGVNNVPIDLDRDAWLYVSERYLGQEAAGSEAGSLTMSHKVSPINFENSEDNLSKANADLGFLTDYVTTSRLQRDLSDSAAKRNIGTAFAHCLIGYKKTQTGFGKVVPNGQVTHDELDDTPAIIGEAVQTTLRREGDTQAHERVKELTRGREATLDDFHNLSADLDVDEGTHEELLAFAPATYADLADELTDDTEN